jgi:hypothetical protein
MRGFLSHSSADGALARRIFNFLRDQAVSVWFDDVELRPGDSLLLKISAGIEDANFVLGLITRNSVSSAWVQKELSIAISKEMAGEGVSVIPLIVEGCEMPTMLADRFHVRIPADEDEFQQIIPALFRDSFIVDIPLNADLSVDRSLLRKHLYDYTRSKYPSVRVRILNDKFNSRARRIADGTFRSLSEDTALAKENPSYHQQLLRSVREGSELLDIEVPLFWTALAECVSGMCNAGFGEFGKNLDGVETLTRAVENTVRVTLYGLGRKLRYSLFSSYAEKDGEAGLAAWLRSVEAFKYKVTKPDGSEHFTNEEIVLTLLESWDAQSLFDVEMEGDKTRDIMHTRLFVPLLQDSSKMLLFRPPPASEIMPLTWYAICLPQVVERAVFWAVFRLGKPMYELKSKVGFRLEDYTLMGLA